MEWLRQNRLKSALDRDLNQLNINGAEGGGLTSEGSKVLRLIEQALDIKEDENRTAEEAAKQREQFIRNNQEFSTIVDRNQGYGIPGLMKSGGTRYTLEDAYNRLTQQEVEAVLDAANSGQAGNLYSFAKNNKMLFRNGRRVSAADIQEGIGLIRIKEEMMGKLGIGLEDLGRTERYNLWIDADGNVETLSDFKQAAEYAARLKKLRSNEDKFGIPRKDANGRDMLGPKKGGPSIRSREIDAAYAETEQNAAFDLIKKVDGLSPERRAEIMANPTERQRIIEARKKLQNPLNGGSLRDPLPDLQSSNGQGGGPLLAQAPYQGNGYRLNQVVGPVPLRGMGGGGGATIESATADQNAESAGQLPPAERNQITRNQERRAAEGEARQVERQGWGRNAEARAAAGYARDVFRDRMNLYRQSQRDKLDLMTTKMDYALKQQQQKNELEKYKQDLEYNKELRERKELIEALEGTGNLWSTFFGNLFDF